MGPDPDELHRAPGHGPAAARARPGNATDPRDGDVLGLDRETYLHAVATGAGLRLDEHLNELVERPALASVLGARDSVA